ncbi:MAG: ABC transporter permease subunit [Clostridiaceae bacterium]|jgi:ABC-2 type transport system permease protein|nr:ABC transporter permease subunit [Clostridiaceae bacterium]
MMLNPILEKDLKTKMRGWRTFILLSLYLIFLGGVLYLYFLSNNLMFDVYGYSTFNPRIAVNAYNVIALFQFSLLALIVPALTATAISGERERQTLDLLLCSGISTLSIVIGKLLVSIANIMLLVVASLPILGIVFLFGGIGLGEVLLMFLYYIITALMAASLGIFLSTIFRKNVTAIIASYVCFAILAIGPVITLFIWAAFFGRNYSGEVTYGLIAKFLFPSPGFGFISFLTGGRSSMLGFGSLFNEINNFIEREPGWLRYFQPWMLNSIFNILFSCILIYLSAWKLNPIKKRRKKVSVTAQIPYTARKKSN